MRTARVYNDTGKIAAWGKDPKPISNTTEIEEPIPSDYNPAQKPYLWNFTTSAWVVDQGAVNAKSDKRAKREQHQAEKEQTYVAIKALLDDPATNWNDPKGDILKFVVEQINILTADLR